MSALARLRLRAQGLAGGAATPVEAVRSLLALQGQDYAGAKWSIGLRASGTTAADVEAALASGAIVRSWPLRGTLHLVAGEDLRWILDLVGPRMIANLARRRASLGLEARGLRRARAVAERRLAGCKALARDELLAAFEAAGLATGGQRGYHLLAWLAQEGTLCFGPQRGNAHTFVLLDEWVPRPRRLARDEALGELARRYFEGHGPATVRDFANWTKLTADDVRRSVGLARPALVERAYDGVPTLAAAASLAPAPRAAGSVVLLPGFDEYLLGYQDRSAALAAEHKELIVPGGNGVFRPTVVVDGRVVGTWRRGAGKGSGVEASLFDGYRFSRAEASAFARTAAAHARFWGEGGERAPA